MISLPPPVFLGFAAKLPYSIKPDEWGGATEICSISHCLEGYPEGWDEDPFNPPLLNAAYCVGSVDEASSRIRQDLLASARAYAYRIIPAVFENESADPAILTADALFSSHGDLPQLPAAGSLDLFEHLGFDVTQYEDYTFGWGCSPLSCNRMFQHHPVNRYCLLDKLDDAVNAAQAFARDEPEPGPYVIVEVFRKRNDVENTL